jgi:hypothetical protein
MKKWVEDKSRTNRKTGWSSTLLSQRRATHVPGVGFLHVNPFSRTASKFRFKFQHALEPDLGLSHFAYLDTSVIMKPKKRAIILPLPESLVHRLDTIVSDLQMPSRSYYLRRSVERALDFSETHELPSLNDLALQRSLAR